MNQISSLASYLMSNSAQINGSSKIATDGKESFAYYLAKIRNGEVKENKSDAAEQKNVGNNPQKGYLLFEKSLFKGTEGEVITLDKLKGNLFI